MNSEWVVLLEVGAPHDGFALPLDRLQRLVGALGDDQSAALHHPQRYALQLFLSAPSPADALAMALGRWRRALREVGLPEWTVCRAEVLTRDEFKRDFHIDEGSSVHPPAGHTPAPALAHSVGGPTRGAGDAASGIALDLLREAFSDPVTGLAGRALFDDELRLALEGGAGPTTVVVVDVNSFGAVNRTVGYAAADEVLAVIGGRITQAAPQALVAARLGGDRFGVVLASIPAAEARTRIAEPVLAAIHEPLRVYDAVLRLTATVGLADSTQSTDPSELLNMAEAAVRAAKQAGGGGVAVFDPSHQRHPSPAPDRSSLVDRLSHLLLLQRSALAASDCRDLAAACELVMREVGAHTDWQIGRLYMPDRGGEIVVPSGVEHRAEGPLASFMALTGARTYGRGKGVPGRVLATGRPAWSANLTAECEPDVGALAAPSSICCTLGIPVMVGTEVAGVIEFFGSGPLPPDGSLLEVLTTIGAQLGRIVERCRAERAAEGSELRYRALVEAARHAVIISDQNCVIVGWSGAATRIFGYAEPDITGKALATLFGLWSSCSSVAGALDAGPLPGQVAETTGIRGDGSAFRAEVSVSSWDDNGSRFFTHVVRDMGPDGGENGGHPQGSRAHAS